MEKNEVLRNSKFTITFDISYLSNKICKNYSSFMFIYDTLYKLFIITLNDQAIKNNVINNVAVSNMYYEQIRQSRFYSDTVMYNDNISYDYKNELNDYVKYTSLYIEEYIGKILSKLNYKYCIIFNFDIVGSRSIVIGYNITEVA